MVSTPKIMLIVSHEKNAHSISHTLKWDNWHFDVNKQFGTNSLRIV